MLQGFRTWWRIRVALFFGDRRVKWIGVDAEHNSDEATPRYQCAPTQKLVRRIAIRGQSWNRHMEVYDLGTGDDISMLVPISHSTLFRWAKEGDRLHYDEFDKPDGRHRILTNGIGQPELARVKVVAEVVRVGS